MSPQRRFRRMMLPGCPAWWVIALFLATCGPAPAADAPPNNHPPAANPSASVGQLQVRKVLILGNSITLHGVAPHIGWHGNWGMAASDEGKDYVHLLLQKIALSSGRTPEAMVKNIADFERGLEGFNLEEGLKPELKFEADLVILAIGENVSPLATDEAKARYQQAFSGLLTELMQHGHPQLLVRSCFWADPAKDEIMQQACQQAGGVFIHIGKLGSVEANFARSEQKFEHAGVAAHPGDQGMQAISDEIWKAIQAQPTLWQSQENKPPTHIVEQRLVSNPNCQSQTTFSVSRSPQQSSCCLRRRRLWGSCRQSCRPFRR